MHREEVYTYTYACRHTCVVTAAATSGLTTSSWSSRLVAAQWTASKHSASVHTAKAVFVDRATMLIIELVQWV